MCIRDRSKALDTNSPVTSSTVYDDWRGKSFETTLESDDISVTPKGSNYGDPLSSATSAYSKGDTVTAQFWSTNPSAYYVTGNNYMLVEVQKSSGWQTIATDSDWTTTVRWRKQDESFIATLSWHTPKTIEAGRYRLTHQGQDAEGNVFRGISGNIQIN